MVGARTVARLLKELHYSLQANRKTREGADGCDLYLIFAEESVMTTDLVPSPKWMMPCQRP
jgi:hypothetical protein